MHQYLGISREPGLSDYLTDGRLEPYCYLRRVGDLFVIPAGGPVDNPVELLSGEGLKKLFQYLRGEFKTILLDCPPLEPVADARILDRFVDGVLLVVRSGKTRVAAAERAQRHVKPDKAVGVVLNDVKPLLLNTYYNRGYYYGKTNGYPYHPSEKDEE